MKIKIGVRGGRKIRISVKCKKVGPSSGCSKLPRRRVHGPTDVQYFKIKRNRRRCCVEIINFLNVKVNRQ